MNKTIRIVLYVLSILTVAGVIAAAILTGGQVISEELGLETGVCAGGDGRRGAGGDV